MNLVHWLVRSIAFFIFIGYYHNTYTCLTMIDMFLVGAIKKLLTLDYLKVALSVRGLFWICLQYLKTLLYHQIDNEDRFTTEV